MTAKPDSTSSSITERFMFAMVLAGIWTLMNWIALLGSLLFAAGGLIALCKQFRATPVPDRWRVMKTGVASALVFVVVLQIQVGYNVGKYLARQDNATCGQSTHRMPGHSSTGCPAR